MAKAPKTFDKDEAAILKVLYESPNLTYDSYGLAKQLYPEAKVSSPEALAAFTDTRAVTERLMVRGLVAGERNSGANGVYFDELKLTKKGEKAAMQHPGDA